MRLTTELTGGTGPEIEPISSADNDVSNHHPNWLVWSTQNYDIASGTSDYVATSSSKNAFCAEVLSRPALAVENNRFMTSQHDSSLNGAH